MKGNHIILILEVARLACVASIVWAVALTTFYGPTMVVSILALLLLFIQFSWES